MVEVNKLPTNDGHDDRRRAFEGARYVISCVRVGGVEAYADDTGSRSNTASTNASATRSAPAGCSTASATIPVILDFCRDIREVAEPGALLLNYANPMAMNTWAAIDYGGRDTIGLCHGVQHGGRRSPTRSAPSDPRMSNTCAAASTTRPGTSTCGWRAAHRPRRTARRLRAASRYSQQEKVRIDVLRRFGVYSTESNGHLSEYLPWYRKRPEEIRRWIDMSDWIHGETGGYLRHCTETRNWFETEYPGRFRGAKTPLDPPSAPTSTPATSSRRWRPGASTAATSTSGTAASSPISPQDAIVESPGFVDRFGLNMVAGPELPMAARPPARRRSTSSAWRSKRR